MTIRNEENYGTWIHGSSGKMGNALKQVATLPQIKEKFSLLGGSAQKFEGELFYQGRKVDAKLLGEVLLKDKISVVFDFSSTSGNKLLLEAVQLANVKETYFMIGTTALDSETVSSWRTLAKSNNLRVLFAENTSIGIPLLLKSALSIAKTCLPLNFDIEIIETHHRQKLDAPSGTAKMLTRKLCENIDDLTEESPSQVEGARKANTVHVHAVRGGSIFGEHEIRFLGDNEEISITHRALNRDLFAQGAFTLANWLLTKKPGIYEITDI